MELLISAGYLIHLRGAGGIMPIHAVADSGCIGMLTAQLKHGADINARDDDGQRPLNYIQSGGFNTENVIQLLLASGVDYTIPNKFGWTILHNAAQFGTLRLLEILTNARLKDVNLDGENHDGGTALRIARRRIAAPDDFLEAFQVLLLGIQNRTIESRNTSMGILRGNVHDHDETRYPFIDALENQA